MAEPAGPQPKEKTGSLIKPADDRGSRKRLISARHSTAVSETTEEQLSPLLQRAAVRPVPGGGSASGPAEAPAPRESRFAHDFSRVPTLTVAPPLQRQAVEEPKGEDQEGLPGAEEFLEGVQLPVAGPGRQGTAEEQQAQGDQAEPALPGIGEATAERPLETEAQAEEQQAQGDQAESAPPGTGEATAERPLETEAQAGEQQAQGDQAVAEPPGTGAAGDQQLEAAIETIGTAETGPKPAAPPAAGPASEAGAQTTGQQAQGDQAEPASPGTGPTGERPLEAAIETIGTAGAVPKPAAPPAAGPAVTADAIASAAEAITAPAESAQKSLESETNAGTQQLAEEAAALVDQEMQQGSEGSAGTGVVQRGVLSTIRGVASRGAGWIMSNIVGPIRQAVSAGWNRVTQLAGRFSEAYSQTTAPSWQVHRRAFQAFARLRDQAATEAIERQRAERQRAVAEGRMTPAQAAEPSALERIDAVTDMFESGIDSVLGVQSEILEGAVVGDFVENPTAWHTVGQIAIGFVPYAGQVADVRDLVACIRKLATGGYRDPVEWINLVLIGIGFIPGLGDIIKAGGRGAIKFLQETGPTILRRGREIWQQVARRVPQLIEQARVFGRRLWEGARRQGERLADGARRLAQRAGDSLRSAREAVEGAVRRARERARNIGRSIREGASNLMNRVRRLLGPVGDAIGGAIRSAVARARRVVSQAADLVRRGIQRVQDAIGRLRQQASEFYQRARRFITETVPNAVRRAREWAQDAWRRGREAISRRVAQGRRMLESAYRRARDFIADRVRGLKERAIRFLQERIRPLANRIRQFLMDRLQRLWKQFSGIYGAARTLFVNWLRERFGIQLPEGGAGPDQTGGPGTEPSPPGTEPSPPGTEPSPPGTEPGGGPGTEPGGGPGPGPGQTPGPGPGQTPPTPTPGQPPGRAIPRRIVIDGFAFSEATLPTHGPGIVHLNQLCSLDESAKARIRITSIEGHTDRVPVRRDGGRYESLEDLSAMRADAVKEVLKKAGLETPSANVLRGAADAQVPRNASNRARARDRKVVVLWEAR